MVTLCVTGEAMQQLVDDLREVFHELTVATAEIRVCAHKLNIAERKVSSVANEVKELIAAEARSSHKRPTVPKSKAVSPSSVASHGMFGARPGGGFGASARTVHESDALSPPSVTPEVPGSFVGFGAYARPTSHVQFIYKQPFGALQPVSQLHMYREDSDEVDIRAFLFFGERGTVLVKDVPKGTKIYFNFFYTDPAST
jgi:hypothetical protein